MSSEGRKQKRKATARKHLIDTLSMKHAGECPLSRRHSLCQGTRNQIPQIRASMETPKGQQKLLHTINNGINRTEASPNRFKGPGNVGGKLQNHKADKTFTFPAIVNDLNTFIYSGAKKNAGTDSSSSTLSCLDVERRNVCKSFLRNKSNLRKQQLKANMSWTKHRPLTPNLIKMLNKAKLSSAVQTERWVQQLPVLNSWRFSSNSYKDDRIDNEFEEQTSPRTYRTWIFDDTKRKVNF